MQLAGLVDGGHQRPAGGRGVLQKVDQAIYAQALERRWSKQQVLEAYLNLVPFRGEIIGVDALSRVLFQKHASGLDARDSRSEVSGVGEECVSTLSSRWSPYH